MKKMLLLASLLINATMVMAETLTPQEALQRLHKSSSSNRMMVAGKYSAGDLVYTEYKESSPMVYLFNKSNNGFIVVGADDVAVPLLGYSDNANIDVANMPENMRYWLEMYANQIEAAKKAGTSKSNATRAEKEEIANLCTTLWDQKEPYNNMCPELDGERCATGCSATALAQVMKYHNWPDQGVGTYSYEWNNTTLSIDFSACTFQWDKMRNTYEEGEYTEEEGNAVALLMKACGYAHDMNYNPTGSGTNCETLVENLIGHFKYAKETTLLQRDYFRTSDWEDIIYTSLRNQCPVLYIGSDNLRNGHAFVCDGYRADGYFHINWGWSGMSDGYFLLSALNPEKQGTGGADFGFNFNQEALIMAQPVFEESDYLKIVSGVDKFSADYDAENGTLVLGGGYMNQGSGTSLFQFGVEITNEDGETEYLPAYAITGEDEEEGLYASVELESQQSAGEILTLLEGLKEGKYTIRPVFASNIDADESEWKHVYSTQGSDYVAYITVDQDGNVTSLITADDETDAGIIENFQIDSPMIEGKPFLFTATISNPNDVAIEMSITPVALSENYVGYMGQNYRRSLEPHQTLTFSDYACLYTQDDANAKSAPAGNYRFAFINIEEENEEEEEEDEGNFIDVTIMEFGSPVVTCNSFVIENSGNLDPSNMVCHSKISCSGGNDVEDINIYIYDEDHNFVDYSTAIPKLYLLNGDSVEKDFTVSFTSLEGGKTYIACILYGNSFINETKITTTTTGVEKIATNSVAYRVDNGKIYLGDETITRVEVYSMDGRRCAASVAGSTVDVSSLASGTYILKVTTKDGVKTSVFAW